MRYSFPRIVFPAKLFFVSLHKLKTPHRNRINNNTSYIHRFSPENSSMAAEISYICRRTVVSTKPVQPGKRHRLSALDRAMEHRRVRIVLYYRTPPEREIGEATKRLRESMSEMLVGFPMVTGRLERNEEGEWVVRCNDAGVRMVEARGKGSVEEWLKSVDREKELKLLHWEDVSHKIYFWSTFYVQLTEFEGGGLAIGLSCTHLLADPICATMIIKAWAHTSLIGQIPNPPLSNSSSPLIKWAHTHLINHCKSSPQKPNPNTNTKYTTIALLFPTPMVEACMEMAKPNINDSTNIILPSPFQALVGLFWTCISNVKGLTKGLMNMSICLDMRKLLGLNEGFFGNCMMHSAVHGGDLINGHDQMISTAAMAVKGVMEKMDNEGVMDNSSSSVCMCGSDDPLLCTNLEDVGPYSAVFEDGYVPVRVSYHVEPVAVEGQVVVLPAPPPPEEGALSRVVMVTLPEDAAVKLCEDAVILSLSPIFLMGFNKN